MISGLRTVTGRLTLTPPHSLESINLTEGFCFKLDGLMANMPILRGDAIADKIESEYNIINVWFTLIPNTENTR